MTLFPHYFYWVMTAMGLDPEEESAESLAETMLDQFASKVVESMTKSRDETEKFLGRQLKVLSAPRGSAAAIVQALNKEFSDPAVRTRQWNRFKLIALSLGIDDDRLTNADQMVAN